MAILQKERTVEYYKNLLDNNYSNRLMIDGLITTKQFEKLKDYKVFSLLKETKKNDKEDYICFDFTIEFFKKYSSLENFSIPRKRQISNGVEPVTPAVSFISNLQNKIFSKNKEKSFEFNNNFQEIQTPENFTMITYYEKFHRTDFELELTPVHTGLLIEFNSNFYVISKFGSTGIFIHDIENSPTSYGETIKFFKIKENKEFENNKNRLYPLIIRWLTRKNYLQ